MMKLTATTETAFMTKEYKANNNYGVPFTYRKEYSVNFHDSSENRYKTYYFISYHEAYEYFCTVGTDSALSRYNVVTDEWESLITM